VRAMFLLFAFASTVAGADRPPNIVLIVADDLGYGDAGCYGAKDIRTPNLDRIAKEGTRFTNFNVAQPVCTASRAALMTGCYPNRIGLAGALNHTSITGIHPNLTLLPEYLKTKGYATACLGKWHLGTRPAFDPTKHGFDTWFGIPYSNDNGPLHPVIRDIPALPLIENGKTVELDPDQSTFTKRFTEKSTAFIAANRDKPFFLYLPHVMPHVPIFASKDFRGRSKRGLYGDVVEELDWSVGEVMKSLKDNGVDQSTLVLFLSDNGPFLSYGHHAGNAEPFREGKLTTFEGGVRVPFVARWPGRVPANAVSKAFVTGLDLLPTLATFAGIVKLDLPVDGLDLSESIIGKSGAKDRDTFAYYSGSELHAVRSGRWKLHLPHDYLTVNGPPGRDGKPANFAAMKPLAIEESGIRGIASRHGYKVERIVRTLYDLDGDPGESRDVAAANPDVVKRLLDLAESYRADLGDAIVQRKGSGLREVGRDPAK
jgi:arylsulfatase A-like enzyme